MWNVGETDNKIYSEIYHQQGTAIDAILLTQIHSRNWILANITAIENLARQLKDLEENVTEIQIINKIVSILPQQYSHFKLWWDSLDESQQTTYLLTTRLLSEERRIGKTNIENQAGTSRVADAAFSTTHYSHKFKRVIF